MDKTMSSRSHIAKEISVTTNEQTKGNIDNDHKPVVPLDEDPVGSMNHLLS